MKTIIVTGGAGYIGSHTIIELLNNTDFEIVSVDNFSNSTEATYGRIKELTSRPFQTLTIDLCDSAAVTKGLSQFPGITGIIHFAAFKSVPDSVADPLMYYHNNNASLVNLLKYCGKNKINNFIFSSSCSVYGNAKELPVTEETPLAKAESPYGHTKQMGEDMINFYCHSNHNFNAVLLRYFNPVGAHMSGKNGEYPINKPNNLVPIITQTALGMNSLTVFGNDYDTKDGYCVRDFIHVTDVADAHIKALSYLMEGKNKKQLSLYNVGTGDGVSVYEAIQSFEKISGKKLDYKVGPRREGDVIAVYASTSLVKKELGWTPKYSLDDMMLSAWKWQQNLVQNKI